MSIEEATDFYALLLGQQKDRAKHYAAKNISGTIAISSDWVCLAAYLLDDMGAGVNFGPDLVRHEVKSVVGGGAYEYQYHKHSWQEKLRKDGLVDHVFISRSADLLNVSVRLATGAVLRANFLSHWQAELDGRGGYGEHQRFRKSVPYGWVESHGRLLMRIANGRLQP